MPAPIEYYRAIAQPPRAAYERVRSAMRRPPIEVPTLHLHGGDDGCIDVASSAGEATWFRGPYELRVVPHVGHFMSLEDPAGIADHVLGWFDRHAGRAAAARSHEG